VALILLLAACGGVSAASGRAKSSGGLHFGISRSIAAVTPAGWYTCSANPTIILSDSNCGQLTSARFDKGVAGIVLREAPTCATDSSSSSLTVPGAVAAALTAAGSTAIASGLTPPGASGGGWQASVSPCVNGLGYDIDMYGNDRKTVQDHLFVLWSVLRSTKFGDVARSDLPLPGKALPGVTYGQFRNKVQHAFGVQFQLGPSGNGQGGSVTDQASSAICATAGLSGCGASTISIEWDGYRPAATKILCAFDVVGGAGGWDWRKAAATYLTTCGSLAYPPAAKAVQAVVQRVAAGPSDDSSTQRIGVAYVTAQSRGASVYVAISTTNPN
jgi:hypothetical protein